MINGTRRPHIQVKMWIQFRQKTCSLFVHSRATCLKRQTSPYIHFFSYMLKLLVTARVNNWSYIHKQSFALSKKMTHIIHKTKMAGVVNYLGRW